MKVLTEDALVVCKHELGKVEIKPSQDLVRIQGRLVLVATDPESKAIKGCPNIGATIKPCQLTLKVRLGYSDFVRINQHNICLDTVVGLTDGTPPGMVEYHVRQPGQTLVSEVV
jgi:hypothetical protein